MTPHVHSFSAGENKADKLSKWIITWIVLSLKNKKIQSGDLLPSKFELACHIGVSKGTMQNAFRIVEDAGYIESKQKLGSFVKDRAKKNIEKMTSKKDLAINSIKKHLKDKKLSDGDALPSIRELSQIADVSTATVRAAIMSLVLQGVVRKVKNTFVLTSRSFRAENVSAKTLVEKVSSNIKKYIINNLNPGDKIPTNQQLVKMYRVSLKTVHDAVKLLAKEGVVYTRRGQYGTVVMSITDGTTQPYNYEKIEKSIRMFIASECKVGDKIPPIKVFAAKYSTSEKTVKKALDNLAEDGYITFMRGRYGGTFVTEIPTSDKDAYTWLAINSEYINNKSN